jgi:aspartate ammonia-lyase
VKSFRILQRCCRMLADRCVAGIRADRERCARYFETSAGLATVLNPRLGYDRVAALVKESLQTGKTLKQLVLEQEIVAADELEALLRKSAGPTL